MQKQDTKVLTDGDGDIQLTCTQHIAIPGMRLLARLGKLLGPAASDLSGLSKGRGLDVLPAVSKLLETLSEDDIEWLITNVLVNCQVVANKRVVALNSAAAINEVFSGRYLLLLRALTFSLQVNYGDFLHAIAASAPAVAVPESGPAASA